MIFLTGATGLVGSFICRKLIKEGYKVRAIKRENSDLSRLSDINGSVEWVEGDILDILTLNESIKGCDHIIHSAGFVSYHKKDADQLYKINAEGTANLVNAAISQDVKSFIHISSVAAIGRSARLREIDETFKWSDADEHTAYGLSKHQAELEVFRGGIEGLQTIILNPALVLGPGPLDRSSTQVFKYVHDEKPFYTEGMMNYVDVRDLADITYAAVEGKLMNGERYIISAGCVSYMDFFRKVGKCLNKKAPNISVNPYLLKVAYYFESFRTGLSGKTPLITKETLKLSQQHLKFKNFKIKQAIDYQFIPIDETISWTCLEIQK